MQRVWVEKGGGQRLKRTQRTNKSMVRKMGILNGVRNSQNKLMKLIKRGAC